jgi:hypothetical protein
MDIFPHSNEDAVKIDRLINDVLIAKARFRAAAFEVFRAEFQIALDSDSLAKGGAPLQRSQVQVFLKALSTYNASTDEWLDVFRSFLSVLGYPLCRVPPNENRDIIDDLKRNPRVNFRHN